MPRKAKTTSRKTAKRKTVKKVAKKTVAKKTVKKAAKKVVKKAAPKAAPKAMKTTAIKKAYKKTDLVNHLVENSGVDKKGVVAVMDALQNCMHRHLRRGGAGEFSLHGVLKCRVVRKPATKARKGINPFTGEATTFKAKPARNVVKVRPLKKLKEMAE